MNRQLPTYLQATTIADTTVTTAKSGQSTYHTSVALAAGGTEIWSTLNAFHSPEGEPACKHIVITRMRAGEKTETQLFNGTCPE